MNQESKHRQLQEIIYTVSSSCTFFMAFTYMDGKYLVGGNVPVTECVQTIFFWGGECHYSLHNAI